MIRNLNDSFGIAAISLKMGLYRLQIIFLVSITKFTFDKFTRKVNYIVNVLDNITIEQFIEKRIVDGEVENVMDRVKGYDYRLTYEIYILCTGESGK